MLSCWTLGFWCCKFWDNRLGLMIDWPIWLGKFAGNRVPICPQTSLYNELMKVLKETALSCEADHFHVLDWPIGRRIYPLKHVETWNAKVDLQMFDQRNTQGLRGSQGLSQAMTSAGSEERFHQFLSRWRWPGWVWIKIGVPKNGMFDDVPAGKLT
jgi:hypothetical protein